MEPVVSSGAGTYEFAFSWFRLIAAAIVALGVLGTIFWLWMLVECATKEAKEGNDKITWVLIILVTHVVGAALYFFARRPKRRAEVGA